MAIGTESFIKVGDENEKSIIADIVAICSSKGKVSFTSKGVKYLMCEYLLKDQNTKRAFGLITDLIKVEGDKLRAYNCDLTIKARPKKIRLLRRLPGSDEFDEFYLAEDATHHTPPFVVKTVNRYAVWDEDIEGKDVKVGLSAFPGRIVIYDNLAEFNKQFDFFPIDSPEGPITGFSRDFIITRNEESDAPYTVFLGEVLDVNEVKVKLTENEIEFLVIEVDCFLGALKIVAGRDRFDLSKLKKGKLLEISANIKADFGVEPTPEAVVDGRGKKKTQEKPQDNENAVTKLADAGYDISTSLANKIKKLLKFAGKKKED